MSLHFEQRTWNTSVTLNFGHFAFRGDNLRINQLTTMKDEMRRHQPTAIDLQCSRDGVQQELTVAFQMLTLSLDPKRCIPDFLSPLNFTT